MKLALFAFIIGYGACAGVRNYYTYALKLRMNACDQPWLDASDKFGHRSKEAEAEWEKSTVCFKKDAKFTKFEERVMLFIDYGKK